MSEQNKIISSIITQAQEIIDGSTSGSTITDQVVAAVEGIANGSSSGSTITDQVVAAVEGIANGSSSGSTITDQVVAAVEGIANGSSSGSTLINQVVAAVEGIANEPSGSVVDQVVAAVEGVANSSSSGTVVDQVVSASGNTIVSDVISAVAELVNDETANAVSDQESSVIENAEDIDTLPSGHTSECDPSPCPSKEIPTKYILVLDGGGIRGIFTAKFLECLEEYLIKIGRCKESIHGMFTIFSGASTGSIIAACLATGKYSAKSICRKVYSNTIGKRIFSKKQGFIKRTMKLVPTYHAEPRRDIGYCLYGNKKMSELRHKLIIPTYNISKKKPYFWSNIGGGPNPRVLDVVMASSAAPTYFPAEQIFFNEVLPDNERTLSDEYKKLMAEAESGDGYIDGGMQSNSPTTITYAYAKKVYPGYRIKVLSVGTGADRKPLDFNEAKNAGALYWVTTGDIIGIAMDAPDQVNQLESELLDADNFMRVNLTNINEDYVSLKMDCVDDDNMNKLRELGKTMFEEYLPDLRTFLEL